MRFDSSSEALMLDRSGILLILTDWRLMWVRTPGKIVEKARVLICNGLGQFRSKIWLKI